MKTRALLLGIPGLFLPMVAHAAWPADDAWVAFQMGGVDVYDVSSDHDADGLADGSVDLVGDATLFAPVAYWYADDDAFYLRMRVNEDPLISSTSFRASSWAFLLDTDGVDTTWEYQIGVTGPVGILELNENSIDTGLGPYDPVDVFAASWVDPLGDDMARVVDAGTNIDSAPDFFIDMMIPRITLDDVTGSALAGTFGVVILTEHLPGLTALDNDIAGNDDLAGPGSMPTHTTDKIGIDQDGDGLSDPEEAVIGTDPADGDSDDDGLGDEQEVDLGTDPNACDTDGDGIPDGVEAGVVEPTADTDVDGGCFEPDTDPTTTTDPTLADTDGGGLSDGAEDRDGDGAIDDWETDPNDPSDDVDADGDGIADALEDECPEDGTADDQDGDGLLDADEGLGDTDGDGAPDFCDPDDDEDGLPTAEEGTEDSDGDGIPDNRDPDSDDDGVPDGEEGTGDDDCDGIPNYQDPDDTDGDCADPDGDGLNNGEESDCASDPGVADTDGDGIPDGDESCTDDGDCDGTPDVLDDTDDALCDEDTDDTASAGACDKGDAFLDCGHYTGGACSVIQPDAAILPALLALGALIQRRRRRIQGGVVVGGMLLSGGAAAQDEFNAQRFRPVPDATGLLGVDDSAVPGQGLGAGFWFDYAADPLVYRYDDGTEARLTGDVATGNIGVFYTLSRFRLAAMMPLHLSAGSDVGEGGFSPGDLRFDLKATLVDRRKTGFGVALGGDLGVPTGNTEAWLGDGAVSWGGRVVATAGRKRGIASLNVGLRGGPPATLLPDLDWATRLTFGAGGAVPVVEELDVFAEIDGETALTQLDAPGSIPLEWRAGLHYYPRREIVVTGGFGMGITTGVGSPDYRILAGLAWVPAPPAEKASTTATKGLDRDGDGIPDAQDLCPGQPEDRNGVDDEDGCPDAGYTPTRLQVIDPRGQRVAGASVELVSGPESGRYVLGSGELTRSLPPGAYRVEVAAEGYEPEAANMNVPDAPKYEQTFTMKPMIAGGRVIVIATNEQGAPVAALVTVLGGGRKFTTGADGVGEEKLPLGKTELSVWAEGFQAERVRTDIVRDEPSKVTVVLKPARAIVREDRVEILDKVFFEFDSATIKAESFRILDEVTAVMLNHPEITLIEVQGHTDDQGSDEYNLKLSERRANAVRDYLVSAGVESDRLIAAGYGEGQPLQQGTSEEAREANRRVVFKIMKGGSGSVVRPPDATPHEGGRDGKPPRPEGRPDRR